MDTPSEVYQTAVQLFEDLQLPYIEARNVLEAADYTGHWSTAGHQKVGAYLSECLLAYFASGALSDCQNVIMP